MLILYYGYVILVYMNDHFYPQTVTVRIPGVLEHFIEAEALRLCFFKPDGRANTNAFINKILPNILAFRSKKKGRLRGYIDANVKTSIKADMQKKVPDLLEDAFDYLYFEVDELECDENFTIRFDVENEEMYAKLFVRLAGAGIKRSTYLRNLIWQYFNLSTMQRERLCFAEEYRRIAKAMEGEKVVQFFDGKESVNAQVISLEYSVIGEYWYVLYFSEGEYETLYSVPLHRVSKVLLLHSAATSPPPYLSDRIHGIIESGEFETNEKFDMRGAEDA